jgi:glycerophosphoryl diester phosphodiesterase
VVGVPTLASVLHGFPLARVIIELKEPSDALVHGVVDTVRRLDADSRVCVGSFHASVLTQVRAIAPRIATSASLQEAKRTLIRSWIPWPSGKRAPYYAFQVPEWSGRVRVVRPAFVRQAHRDGAAVQVWTVDNPADVRRLLDWGVDGVISDRPDWTVPARDAWLAAGAISRA